MPKVLHVFYSFLPDLSGSSIRSAGLVSGQLTQRMNVVLLTSPFQPGFGDAPVEEYRGIPLYRAYRRGNPLIREKGNSPWARLGKLALFPGFVLLLRRIARAEKVTVIHAHSTFYCALASYLAARSLGLTYVYEFRSLWEERAKSSGPMARIQSHVFRWLESVSLRLADRAVTINEGLKADVVARGIPASKIAVVPNAVEDGLIELGRELAPPTTVTRFGYIGNLSQIEGLDVLVHAFRRAFPDDPDVQLLFHGLGPFEEELTHLVTASNDPRIRICGPFKRDDVKAVYASVDCIVLPRHRTKLNDTVTPLKPLEAMAFSRLVGVSDARGLLEVIGDRSNAWVFRADDVEHLAAALQRVRRGDVDAPMMAARGRAYVCEQRAWSAIARTYADLYALGDAHGDGTAAT